MLMWTRLMANSARREGGIDIHSDRSGDCEGAKQNVSVVKLQWMGDTISYRCVSVEQ
jgi:hypothetical protein